MKKQLLKGRTVRNLFDVRHRAMSIIESIREELIEFADTDAKRADLLKIVKQVETDIIAEVEETDPLTKKQLKLIFDLIRSCIR